MAAKVERLARAKPGTESMDVFDQEGQQRKDQPFKGKLTGNLKQELKPVAVPLPLPAKMASQKWAFTVDAVHTPEECKALIDWTESHGYEHALVNVGGNRQRYMPEVRNSYRCIIDDKAVAAMLWKRIQPLVPQVWHGCPVVGLNERLRFLRYDPGEKFEEHFDGQYRRTDGSGERSFITYQLYLNEEFSDGCTTFLDSSSYTNRESSAYCCKPQTGKVLLFEHALLHRGDPPVKGRKYCLRTDVMYGSPPPAEQERLRQQKKELQQQRQAAKTTGDQQQQQQQQQSESTKQNTTSSDITTNGSKSSSSSASATTTNENANSTTTTAANSTSM